MGHKTRKVYEAHDAKYKSVPAIHMQGKWLEKLGFHAGDAIDISCEDGKIVITAVKQEAGWKE